MKTKLSIIIPCKDEAESLLELLPDLVERFPLEEIIIVDDASSDDSVNICEKFNVKLIEHPYSKGNGAAIKTGARAAQGEVFLFMDADGQHSPEDIHFLLEKMEDGYDMVVAARSAKSHANIWRYFANLFYNYFAGWVTGHRVEDLTSGFRAIRANKFLEFIQLLPNGFSYPTTITMAFFRSGYSVKYLPINVLDREGNSHINPTKDGIRFLLIIFKIGTLYSPLKFYFPVSTIFFITGFSYYLYTFFTQGRFTNMSALLLITSILVFLIGLVSEQLTMLFYRDKK